MLLCFIKIFFFLFRCTGDFRWCILILHMWEAVKNNSCFLLSISCNLSVSTVHSWLCPCSESIPYFLSFLVVILALESCHTELLNIDKGTFHFIIVPLYGEASCCPEQLNGFYSLEKNLNHPPTLSLHAMDMLISTSALHPHQWGAAHLFPASEPHFLILLMHTETLSFHPVTAQSVQVSLVKDCAKSFSEIKTHCNSKVTLSNGLIGYFKYISLFCGKTEFHRHHASRFSLY